MFIFLNNIIKATVRKKMALKIVIVVIYITLAFAT